MIDVDVLLDRVCNEFKKLFSRVFKERQNGYYMIVAIGDHGDGYIVCISGRRDYVYAKIVYSKDALFWNCTYVLESPRGLFIFSKNVDEFIEKLISRIRA